MDIRMNTETGFNRSTLWSWPNTNNNNNKFIDIAQIAKAAVVSSVCPVSD